MCLALLIRLLLRFTNMAETEIVKRFDTDQIRKDKAILDVIGTDVKLHRSGRSFVGLCPFHEHHKDTPSFAVWPDTNTWRCFGLCSEGGDVIDYVMKRDHCTFVEACERLGAVASEEPRKARQPEPIREEVAPSEHWQRTGWKLIERAQDCLLSHEGRLPLRWGSAGQLSAYDYLCTQRLLRDYTIQRWKLGWIPKDTYMPFSAWGLPTPPENKRGLWLPRGIVIPTFTADGALWSIHVRRPEGDPKYPHISGSHKSLWGTQNIDRRLVFMLGGEFDAMLAEQEGAHIGGSCSPSTGEGSTWSHSWSNYMLRADAIVCGYDDDEAGHKGSWRNVISTTSRAVRANSFGGPKDLTDYARVGGDVVAWMRGHYETLIASADNPHQLWDRIETMHPMKEEHSDYYTDLKIAFDLTAE